MRWNKVNWQYHLAHHYIGCCLDFLVEVDAFLGVRELASSRDDFLMESSVQSTKHQYSCYHMMVERQVQCVGKSRALS